MSMSSNVFGIRLPNAKWKEMKSIWDACNKAGVTIPKEVEQFFDYEEPDPSGVVIPLEDIAQKFSAEMQDGFEIKLSELPDGIEVIRFVNSY